MTERTKGGIAGIVIEMWIGIVLFAGICEGVAVWFVHDRVRLSVGILMGAALACVCTWHMWYMLDSSLGERDEKSAAGRVGTGYLIRYAALIILVAVLYLTGIGSPFGAFAAYMCIKPAAYLQPRLHRFLEKRKTGEVS